MPKLGQRRASRQPESTLPIKRHGGKHYLTKRIIDLMPSRAKKSNAPHKHDPGWVHYVEPYFGGGRVLFAMNPNGISEVVNDIDGELANFWKVLADERLFKRLVRRLEATPMSQAAFNEAKANGHVGDAVERAAAFFVANRQSRQALEKDFATMSRNRTRRGMNEQASSWLSAINGLPEFHRRLQRVVIFNDEALKVIRAQDGPRTLFYLDPPYLKGTRTAPDAYKHEMTGAQHKALLECLSSIEGRFLLSGYRSGLYDDYARRFDWNRSDFEIDNKSGSGTTKQKRTECIWSNYQ